MISMLSLKITLPSSKPAVKRFGYYNFLLQLIKIMVLNILLKQYYNKGSGVEAQILRATCSSNPRETKGESYGKGAPHLPQDKRVIIIPEGKSQGRQLIASRKTKALRLSPEPLHPSSSCHPHLLLTQTSPSTNLPPDPTNH